MASSRWASFRRRPDAAVAILRQYSQHVRVQVGFTVAIAGQRHGETNDGVAVEGSDNLAADALGDHEDAARNDVAVAVAPDLKLQDDATLKVVQGGQGLDVDCRSGCLRSWPWRLAGGVLRLIP